MNKRSILSFTTAALCALLLVPAAACNGDSDKDSDKGGTGEAELCTVTFTDGTQVVERKTEKGTALTDIPEPGTKKGYTGQWSENDFACIISDMTVQCVYTANDYKIYGTEGNVTDEYLIIDYPVISVTFDELYSVPDAERYGYIFVGWQIVDTSVMFENSGTYNEYAEDVTLVAVWEKDENSPRWDYSTNV